MHKSVSFLALGAILAGSMPMQAFAQGPAPVAAPSAGLNRTMTLAELGYAQGLTFRNLSQAQTLYFPVGPKSALTGGVLRLPYVTESAFASRRSLVVQIAGRPARSLALPDNRTQGVLEVPVTAADVREGFIPVVLQYSGVSTEDRCIDERAAGDYVIFAPEGGLSLGLQQAGLSGVQAAAGYAPANLRILLPARPSAHDVAAALTLAAGARGKVAVGPGASATPGWSETTVRVGEGAQPLAIVGAAGGPNVTLGGTDPAAGAKLWVSSWRRLADGASLSGAVTKKAHGPDVSLRSLGGDLSAKDVVGRSDWATAFSLRDLPGGRAPKSVQVQMKTPPDPNSATVVSVALNGEVLASTKASWPSATTLSADIPQGLVGIDNALTISVMRQPQGGDCKAAPQGYPAQLLGSSKFTLAKAGGDADDFNDLTGAFADGVTVILPSADAASVAAILPIAIHAVQRLVPAGAKVSVQFGGKVDGPFIAVADAPPAGVKAPVRFDKGRLQLTAATGEQLFDLAGLEAVTTAQVVKAGKNVGLWLRPGSRSQLPSEAFALDRGDVAFIDADGVALAFSSTRDELVKVGYPDRFTLTGWLGQNRIWVILGGWILVSIGFVIFLQRLYRARRAKA